MYVSLFLIAALFLPDAGQAFERPWDSYVYGENGAVVVDTRLGVERAFGVSRDIEDCSTAEVTCLRGHVFNIVMPRACPEWRVGQSFALGSTRTEVLAVYPRGDSAMRLDDHYRIPFRLLGDPARPGVVYVHAHAVAGLYWDPSGQKDLYGIARSGGVAALNAATNNGFLRAVSLTGVAPCDPPPRSAVTP